MSEAPGVEVVLSLAKAKEREYDWLGASEAYDKALTMVSDQDSSRIGEIHERLGYALHRAGMQAKSREEFRERTRRAIEAKEKAHEFYQKLGDTQKTARMLRCQAVAKYLGYWLTSDPTEKRMLLDECLELERKTLEISLESGDMLEYGRTYNELSLVFFYRFYLEWDRKTSKSILEKGLEWGEKTVASLSELGNLHETAKAYFTLATCLSELGEYFTEDLEEKEKTRLKVVRYLSKAVDGAEQVDDAFLLGLSHLWMGGKTGGDEAVNHYEKALECGKLTLDNFLIGGALDFLAYSTYWKASATEDPEGRIELTEKAMEFYDEAQDHFSIMSFITPRGGLLGPPAGHAEHYYNQARGEPDLKKRQKYLEEAQSSATEALKLAEDSDIPAVIEIVYHVLSKILEARARMESDYTEKRSLLENALRYREKTVKGVEQLAPFDYWNLGVMYNYLAEIKAELADIETDSDSKRILLEEAVLSKERCLELCNKPVPYWERMGEVWYFSALRSYQDAYATLLTNLYGLTNKPEYLRKAIGISQKAIDTAIKLDMVSLMAESYWKIAKAQDDLEEHNQAAENFEYASESYRKAAEKIPPLKSLYQDYASYMQAWSEIEKARHHHGRQEYSLAKEHFEKAADLHKSLKRWSYLAPNYSAWAQVEYAEDLSRKERSEEALQDFVQAAKLFKEARKTLQAELSKIEAPDEKQMATNMIKVTAFRSEYCIGRIALEEARILDKKGDHYSSSEKYGSAAEIFQKISQMLESEREQKEFRFIISLSRAWQKMMLAEARASPELYMDASKLFEQASEHGASEKTSFLTLGHSRFCKALEAGTRFADTRETTMHAVAIRYLESAANYYVKAGFQKASEYAKATGLLFDAYVRMDNAKPEINPEKKARLYMMAEKVLQASAGAYMKAEHPEKRQQILRLLEKVREERELAISLTEVLHAPSIVSTTTAFHTPTPTYEEAVGLEKFENANIQANIITRQKELKVGEKLALAIELVNAGKGPALLIKAEDVIPEGFELTEKPEIYRVEDSYLNMKGKRLDPLKTEEIKLVLRPKVKGAFRFRPRILYLDENGKYKAHEPEPATITVKELGIKGWIKGET